MSSIREVQIEAVLANTVRALYSSGVKPSLSQVFGEVSRYFAQYKPGTPIELAFNSSDRSDAAVMNDLMAKTILNLHTLYDATQSQVDDIMELTSVLRVRLKQLSQKRRRLTSQVEDFLLALYNTDGYYHAFGDTFADLIYTDKKYTNAFVDTQVGTVTLPTLASLTRIVPGYLVSLANIDVFTTPIGAVGVVDSVKASYKAVAPLSGAFDGLTNTFWAVEVETETPSEVIVELTLSVGDVDNPADISKVDIDPHVVSPVQVYLEIGSEYQNAITYSAYGNSIQNSLTKMSFVGPLKRIRSLKIIMRKTQHDYTDNTSGDIKYRYIFGAKEISIVQNVYDRSATFVSTPISIDWAEEDKSAVIDAVSLTTDAENVEGTSIEYFVAIDNSSAVSVADFDWQPISPLSENETANSNVVRFNGSRSVTKKITADPLGQEVQLIPLDSTNQDLQQRNPSAVIVPGVDIYRLAKFEERYLEKTLKLEEGVNTTKIHYFDWIPDAAVLSLEAWHAVIKSNAPPSIAYGKIDQGNDFFYGGDIGAVGKNVLVETILEVRNEIEPFLAEFRKVDNYSLYWPVRIYLNGREVAYLPAGTEKSLIPWTFKQGQNQISVSIVIPFSSTDYLYPYLGTVQLLGDKSLSDLGRVKLSDWNYVSEFDMRYNQARDPHTFTIINNEIVSRRKPTTDFILSYARASVDAPQSIRFRADFSRDSQNPNVAPKLNSYRLRFSYGG